MSKQVEEARMSREKMTGGPWRAFGMPTEPGYPRPIAIMSGKTNVIAELPDSLAADANARAIACLPELVAEAQKALEAMEDGEVGRIVAARVNLRRILARIENGE